MKISQSAMQNIKSAMKDNKTPVVLFVLGILLFCPVIAGALAWDPEDVLRAYLRENYPWADIEISDLSVNGVVPGEQPSKIMIEKGLPGRTVFSFEFENAGRLTATANVRAFDKMVVSRRAFRKGYTFQKDDVYTMLIEVQRIPANALSSVDNVVGKSLSRTISANTPVSSGMLQQGMSVKRGKRVTLLIEARGFTITTAGEIRENGSIGDTVKAVNTSSKKMVAGLLVDENTVKVEL
jgi:flagella basal body P-ring formation protein FlgA